MGAGHTHLRGDDGLPAGEERRAEPAGRGAPGRATRRWPTTRTRSRLQLWFNYTGCDSLFAVAADPRPSSPAGTSAGVEQTVAGRTPPLRPGLGLQPGCRRSPADGLPARAEPWPRPGRQRPAEHDGRAVDRLRQPGEHLRLCRPADRMGICFLPRTAPDPVHRPPGSAVPPMKNVTDDPTDRHCGERRPAVLGVALVPTARRRWGRPRPRPLRSAVRHVGDRRHDRGARQITQCGNTMYVGGSFTQVRNPDSDADHPEQRLRFLRDRAVHDRQLEPERERRGGHGRLRHRRSASSRRQLHHRRRRGEPQPGQGEPGQRHGCQPGAVHAPPGRPGRARRGRPDQGDALHLLVGGYAGSLSPARSTR